MTYTRINLLHVFAELGDARRKVGRLALIDRRIVFEYDPEFLESGLQISPLKLPLVSGVQAMKDREFEGLFGVFNDSLPDGWGRLLLDRQVLAHGIAPEMLGPLDRLAHIGRFGMGMLGYEPDVAGYEAGGESLDLSQLARDAMQVLDGEFDEVVPQLLRLAGSSAGARPKIMVGVSSDRSQLIHGQQVLPPGYEHWMIKFIARSDRDDTCRVEYAYSLMARAAGLEVMPTHLFSHGKNSYFGVMRFDRSEGQRVHMHSLSGLIHADHRMPSIDYDKLLGATQYLTRNMQEVHKAFRLACFNVFAHNRDDHAKNFSYLMGPDGQWRLSPAYDLTFSQGPGGEHCTTILGEGRVPGNDHLMALAKKFAIAKREADAIMTDVRGAISRWAEFAEAAGLGKKTMTAIAKALPR